jgi:hypothetical protein
MQPHLLGNLLFWWCVACSSFLHTPHQLALLRPAMPFSYSYSYRPITENRNAAQQRYVPQLYVPIRQFGSRLPLHSLAPYAIRNNMRQLDYNAPVLPTTGGHYPPVSGERENQTHNESLPPARNVNMRQLGYNAPVLPPTGGHYSPVSGERENQTNNESLPPARNVNMRQLGYNAPVLPPTGGHYSPVSGERENQTNNESLPPARNVGAEAGANRSQDNERQDQSYMSPSTRTPPSKRRPQMTTPQFPQRRLDSQLSDDTQPQYSTGNALANFDFSTPAHKSATYRDKSKEAMNSLLKIFKANGQSLCMFAVDLLKSKEVCAAVSEKVNALGNFVIGNINSFMRHHATKGTRHLLENKMIHALASATLFTKDKTEPGFVQRLGFT